jgi:hypothetical protein
MDKTHENRRMARPASTPNTQETITTASPQPQPQEARPENAAAAAAATPELAESDTLLQQQNDMPMTMAASVVLEHLPRDAHQALSKAGLLEQEKSE